MAPAFELEIRSARTWLLDARSRSATHEGLSSTWGFMQDMRPSPLNTAEVLVALEGDDRLDAGIFGEACGFVMAGLGEHGPPTVRHAAWIAIALDRFAGSCPDQAMRPDIGDCLERARAWLAQSQNADHGWGSLPSEPSSVPTTALALRALGPGFRSNANAAVSWLLGAQNGDGGWGLTHRAADEYQTAMARLTDADARDLVRTRTESNAACTAYAILAISELGRKGGEEGVAIRRGARWLLDQREPRTADNPSSGGWPIFRERGIRADASYTFRHFSTAWAIQALLVAGADPRDADLLEAVEYLRSLQQPPVTDRDGLQLEGGGWRCSQDGEPFMWATSNAIIALRSVADAIGELGGSQVVDILLRERRSLRASFIGREERPWVTNGRTGLLVAAVTTLLAIACIAAVALPPPGKPVGFVLLAGAAFVAAAPWAVVLAIRRDPASPNLYASAGQIYGVLTVVLGILGTAYFA